VAERDTPRPGRDPGALGEAYERLRNAVLSGGTGGWRLGHGVLCARGMSAWMSAVGEIAPPTGAGTEPAGPADVASPFSSAGPGPASAATSMSPPGADQVVAVLTQMVLALAA
jgi:hypothetical protein